MSEVIYTESCHAGLLCMALNLGNSFGSSLLVGVCRIKLNNLTKYVELSVECLRTRVQFPSPPPFTLIPTLLRLGFFWLFPPEKRCGLASVGHHPHPVSTPSRHLCRRYSLLVTRACATLLPVLARVIAVRVVVGHWYSDGD